MILSGRPFIKSVFDQVLDLILPPRCPMTGELVGRQGALDPQYWAKLNFIHAPLCACCGNPFANDVAPDMLCGACLSEPPRFARARAVFRYDDASAGMILKFKHADGTHLAPALGEFMTQSGAALLQEADLLIPVPLHRWRLLKRRFNQATLLGRIIAAQSGVPIALHVLRRARATPPQGKKTKAERHDNIKNAFHVSPAQKHMVQDKRIVLIDDVLTSGATVNECAKVLLANGATLVDVLAVAKVVRAD